MKSKGFTLIEILIVLVIIGTTMALFSFSPKTSQKDYDRFFRRFSLMSKEIRNQALMENATYRIVFRLQNPKAPKIIVEKTKERFLLGDEKEMKEKFEDLMKEIDKPKTTNTSSEETASIFKESSQFSFYKLDPPDDLIIKKIEVNGLPEPLVNSGLIAYHYFSQGQVEQTAITIGTQTNDDLNWTLLVDPISGKIYDFPGEKDLKELQER